MRKTLRTGQRSPLPGILFFLLALGLVMLPLPALSFQLLDTDWRGHPLFRYEIYDAGEQYGPDPDDNVSTWTLGPRDLAGLVEATNYWAAIIGPVAANGDFISIAVGTDDEDNASAGSRFIQSGPYAGMNELAAALLYDYLEDPDAAVAQVTIGLDPDRGPRYLGPIEILPHNGIQEDMASTITHELGHALGMVSTGDYDQDLDRNAFASTLSRWDENLRDSYGNDASSGMQISESSSFIPGSFMVNEVSGGYAFFVGQHARDALGVTDPDDWLYRGLPVNGLEGGEADLSHIELKNSLMSHQDYRNYGVFMEAELAVFKDLGYDIDLKSQFGLSIYESNTNLVNTQGFFARNADGTGWLPGVYNTSIGAIGLHIYGANNTVTQKADILSAGPGAAGIRVDGTFTENLAPAGFPADYLSQYGNNHLTVDQGVRVHAHGAGGTGVMVAYGRDHVLVNRGEIAAGGQGGVGARFDFGSNELGDSKEYRGSYIWIDEYGGHNPDLDQEGLDGALVERFDLTGTVAGSAAAIYISENALVEQINVMRGARIQGDIISRWNPDDPRVQDAQISGPETTTLSFGWLADPLTGEVDTTTSPFGQYTPDRDFSLRYRGNIIGREGLVVEHAGGSLTWQGRMDLAAYEQHGGATLIAEIGDQPSVISARSILVHPGARLGVADPPPFQYGSRLNKGGLPVLVFDAPDYSQDGSVIRGGSGSFAVGAYDYEYSGARWLDPRTVGLDITARRFNRQRGASSAVTAPLALALHNPSGTAIMRRGIEVFAQGREGEADRMLLAWAGNDARLVRDGGLPLARPAHLEAGYRSRVQGHKDKEDPAWLALATDGARRQSAQGLSAQGLSGLWVEPSYAWSSRSGGSGYDIKGPGVRLGYDLWLTGTFYAGLALDMDFPEYESDDADVDARNYTGSLYAGAILPWDVELGVFASYGRNHLEQRRRVHGQRYDADYEADHYGLGAHLGRRFPLGEYAALRPFVAYEYTRLEVDGYNEGQGLYALDVGSARYDLHRVTAGADLGWSFDCGAWLSGRAYYAGLYGDRTAGTSAFFSQDAAARSFKSKGDAMDEHSLGLGLGAGVPLGERLSLNGGYTYVGGKNTRSHLVEAGIRFDF